jgi:hypothetical protein
MDDIAMEDNMVDKVRIQFKGIWSIQGGAFQSSILAGECVMQEITLEK